MAESGSSRAVVVIGVVAAAGILAFMLLDRDPVAPAPSGAPAAPTDTSAAPLTPAPADPASGAGDNAPRPDSERFEGVQRVPLASRGVVRTANLTVRLHPGAGHILRIDAQDSGPQAQWEAVGTVAQWIAFDGYDDVPPGLRMELAVANTMPRAEHAVALAAALRLAMRKVAYPPDALVASLMAPDGALYPAGDPKALATLARDAGMRLVEGPTWLTLLRALGAPAGDDERAEPLPMRRVPADLHSADVERVRRALRDVLGLVGGGKPAELPAPDRWRETLASAETELRGAHTRTLDDIVTVSVAAAAIRQGERAVRFSTERLEEFTKKLIRDDTKLEGWPVDWLTTLVTARVDGEAAIARWRAALPRPKGVRTIRPPYDWMRQRVDQLKKTAAAFDTLRELAVPMERRLPRPYPYNDIRNLAWSGKTPAVRDPTPDWGVYTDRLALVWGQLVIGAVLEPRPVIGRVEVGGAVEVADQAQLVDMIARAEAAVRSASGAVPTREGLHLTEVHRLVGDGRGPANVDRLERLYYAVMLAREARRLSQRL